MRGRSGIGGTRFPLRLLLLRLLLLLLLLGTTSLGGLARTVVLLSGRILTTRTLRARLLLWLLLMLSSWLTAFLSWLGWLGLRLLSLAGSSRLTRVLRTGVLSNAPVRGIAATSGTLIVGRLGGRTILRLRGSLTGLATLIAVTRLALARRLVWLRCLGLLWLLGLLSRWGGALLLMLLMLLEWSILTRLVLTRVPIGVSRLLRSIRTRAEATRSTRPIVGLLLTALLVWLLMRLSFGWLLWSRAINNDRGGGHSD